MTGVQIPFPQPHGPGLTIAERTRADVPFGAGATSAS